jgi:hypothetical protein
MTHRKLDPVTNRTRANSGEHSIWRNTANMGQFARNDILAHGIGVSETLKLGQPRFPIAGVSQ